MRHFLVKIRQAQTPSNASREIWGSAVIKAQSAVEAMIMPGVTVGHGAVIGSRALVTKDVEPYTIVGGNPAKAIRKRFADEEIRMLLEMCWWDWPLEQLERAMPLLCSADIAGLHQFWQSRVVEQR